MIDQAGREDKAGAQQEIAQFSGAAGGGDEQMKQVLDQTDHHAVDRPKSKGGQKGGQLGHIHLNEGRHKGHREVQEHQYESDGGEHGGDSEGAHAGAPAGADAAGGRGVGIGHKKHSFFRW